MTFALLQKRLIENVRVRLRNGELTERGFARQIGVSQPHIHNVLKGVRFLTPKLADLMMGHLGLTILELAELGEVRLAAEKVWLRQLDLLPVPLAGHIGAGREWTDSCVPKEWVLLNRRELTGVAEPLIMHLDSDPALPWEVSADTLVLLDQDQERRQLMENGAWYVVNRHGNTAIRQARLQEGQWIAGAIPVPPARGPQLHLIRARAVWVGQDPRLAMRLSQAGLFLPAAET